MTASELFETALAAHTRAFAALTALRPHLIAAADAAVEAVSSGNRILFCGNGGSAADAQHLAAELVGRLVRDRRALPALALTTDSSALTAIGNDYGFEQVFARQVEALGRAGDVLVAISTSGNSPNVIRAVEVAKPIGIATVGLLGRNGGRLAALVDIPIVVPAEETARIQEAHSFLGHVFCTLIEHGLGLGGWE
ncbi:MAG: D-sedoheptulose 7-phosphate isomerase [Burkholderiaceae bacterium]|nr:D-sedoheptulose 7-phosphate isomerase [Burkholderiaceae bacterium]